MTSPLLPKGITFTKWANQLIVDLPALDIPIIRSADYWQSWASQLVNSNQLQNVPIPTKLAYPNPEDWEKWAPYFVSAVFN